MITPINSVTFKRIQKLEKIQKKSQNNVTEPRNTNSSCKNIKNPNFTGYLSIHKPVTFEQTIEDNYFHLPKITTQDGEVIQLKPDESQLECARNLHEGRSVVFDAPTGMGKTAIAHWCATKNLHEGKKTIYTVPIKALANDKYNEFSKIYGEKNVGLMTGDRKINSNAPIVIMVTEIFDNQTTSMTQQEADKIGTVIYDEAHYIGDEERGGAWEYSLMNIAPLGVQTLALSATIGNAKEFTNWISNISTRPTVRVSVKPEERPVPLVWSVYKGGEFVPVLDSEVDLNSELTDRNKQALDVLYRAEYQKGESYQLTEDDYDFMYNQLRGGIGDGQNNYRFKTTEFKKRLAGEFKSLNATQVDLVSQLMSKPDVKRVRTVHVPWEMDNYPMLATSLKEKDMLPAIIFKLSQTGCESVISNLDATNLVADEDKLTDELVKQLEKTNGEVDLLTPQEKEQMQEIFDKYEKNGVYLGAFPNKSMLLKGWAVHHAGRMPQYKKLIEELFSKKLIKIVVSTSTLGAGINMPAKTVVLTNTAYKKFDPETQEAVSVPLTANEFHQMAGRAGRRGIDTVGNVVLYNLHTPTRGFKQNSDKSNKIDELKLAYELMGSSADNLRSTFRPQGPMIAQYYSQNTDNRKLNELIGKSFRVSLAKDKDKTAQSIARKFENYTQVLVKQGYMIRDYKKQLSLTPKGEILMMSQGMNPLMLSSLMCDGKLSKVTPEQLCQIAGHLVGCSEQEESKEQAQLVSDKVRYFASQRTEDEIQPIDFEVARALFTNKEEKILKSLGEAKVTPGDIKMTDSFSGMTTFLFASMNRMNPENSVANFEEITKGSTSTMLTSDETTNNEYDRKAKEGNVYKIITGSITTLRQMIRVCEYAIENEDKFPNTYYWENLKTVAEQAVDLLDREPINNNPNYENKFSNN